MRKGPLAVKVTTGDEALNRMFALLNGAAELTRYQSTGSLSDYNGDGKKHPLVLVAHANVARFVVDKTPPVKRESGAQVAEGLRGRDLELGSYRFCLLAGCKAAEVTGSSGLYVEFGDAIGIPVVASTTSVAIGLDATKVSLTPQDGGTWKVYYPLEGTAYGLFTPRCEDYVDVLAAMCIDIRKAT